MKTFIYQKIRGQLLPLSLEVRHLSGKRSQGSQEIKSRGILKEVEEKLIP